MRRPGIIGVGLGIVLLLAAGAVGLVVRANLAHNPADCAVPSAAPDKPRGSAGTAPGGGGLHVIEQGFTSLNSGVSFGAIVTNTSTSVAYRTRVTFAFGNKGTPVDQPASPQNTQEIPILLPGQSIGVGITGPLAAPHSATTAEVRLGETTWLTREEAGKGLGPITTTVVSTQHPDEHFLGYLKITYTSATTTCRPLAWRGVATVVRNQSGAIIGGTLQSSDDGCATGSHITGPTALLPVPDDTRTQVFPYCDLQHPPETSNNQIAN